MEVWKISVIVKGMKMPTGERPVHIEIHRDGTVIQWKFGESDEIIGTAVDVPTPHGDLIDAFAFRREMDTNYPFDKFTQSKHGEADAAKSTILSMLAKAPTIIAADE